MAKKEETSNLPISIEDEIKKQLAAQSAQLGALPSNKITLKNKQFILPDGQASAGPLECIIIDFAWFMVHYAGVYNASKPAKPNCMAVGRENPDGGELKPHESVEKPQGADCKTCPKNQWKSDPNGNGKACKNQRRLLILPPKFDETTEPMTIYVSPGGLRNFDSYVSRLRNEHGLLPAQVISEISFDPNQSYTKLMFKFAEKHDMLNDVWAKREAAQEMLFRTTEVEVDAKAA